MTDDLRALQIAAACGVIADALDATDLYVDRLAGEVVDAVMALAVAHLRDQDRYEEWCIAAGVFPGPPNLLRHFADYLEAVTPNREASP